MHGVKLVSTPPAKTAGMAANGFPERLGRERSTNMRKNYTNTLLLGSAVTLLSQARPAAAQMEMDPIASKHTELSPERRPAAGDSARALKLAAELRQAIARYKDTTVAEADGYHMFLPGLKNQKVYHFTNNARGFEAAFHFNPRKPTSLLYKRGRDGKLVL